ncbi:MAG TPA: methyl-accepting chemotaxis protein [Clostridia bacterium]|nr:methyl-accepting chemotaxis protein [Clostridia bacterium]
MINTIDRKRHNSIKIKLIAIPLVLVFIAVLTIGAMSSYLIRTSLIDQMRASGYTMADQIVSKIQSNAGSLEMVNEMIEDKLRVAGNVVIRNQNNLNNELLISLLEELEVDELHWFNKEGEIIYSTIEGYLGWKPAEDHPLYTFMLSDQQELMEEIREDAEFGNFLKYGAIKNTDGTFVQIGINANVIQELTERFSYQKLVEELAKNNEVVYALFIDKNAKAVASSDKDEIGEDLTYDVGSVTAAVQGQRYASEFTYEEDNKTITAYDILVPVSINGEHSGALNIGLSMEGIHASINRSIMIVTVIGLLAFIILGAILMKLSIGIANPIINLSQIIDRLSKYDLSFDENSVAVKYLKRKDEIGLITKSLATMQNSIVSLIKDISNIAQQVASSSEELTATSQQSATAADEVARTIEEIARGAGDQAKNTEEGAVHINVLGQLIEKDQEYIKALINTANEVDSLRDEGLEGLKALVEKTNANNKASKYIHEIIINTNESATKIENASQMIKSIADQTNLLALNAAIEAARAGETGRGFAVVADEIRRLSEQSNEFTSEISEIIQDLTKKTQHAVETMEEVGKLVASQAKSVEESNEKFEGIAAAIEKMKMVIADVNQSGHEMEAKKDQIISIIENLSAISEENAAGTQEASASIEEQTSSVEEIANASESLAKLAEEMQGSISKFKY